MFIRVVRIWLVGVVMSIVCASVAFASTDLSELNGIDIDDVVVAVNVTASEVASTFEGIVLGVGNTVQVINSDNLAGVIANGDISAEPSGVSLGQFLLTSYCSCSKCNGKWAGGPTAYGTILTTGRTIAVDSNIIPLGSWVEINIPGVGWQKFRAEDTGSGVRGNHIDVYVGANHQECYNSFYNGMAEVRLLQ